MTPTAQICSRATSRPLNWTFSNLILSFNSWLLCSRLSKYTVMITTAAHCPWTFFPIWGQEMWLRFQPWFTEKRVDLFNVEHGVLDELEDVSGIPNNMSDVSAWPVSFVMEPLRTIFDPVTSELSTEQILSEKESLIYWSAFMNHDIKSLHRTKRSARTTWYSYSNEWLQIYNENNSSGGSEYWAKGCTKLMTRVDQSND